MVRTNESESRFTVREAAIVAIILLPFFYWLVRQVNADLWYDEVFTLTNYVLVPLNRTVTDYSFPNNHVFANLLNNGWLQLLGVREIGPLLDRPWLIRILPLAATLGTLTYVYLTGRRFLGRFQARVALVVLTTTLPFFNFALQVRGFSLSMLFITALVYRTLAWEQNRRWYHAVRVVVATTLALYTIPLNLYAILALGGFLAVAGIIVRGRPRRSRLTAAGLMLGGTLLALLFYVPVLGPLFGNRFVASHGLFHLPTLFRTLPLVLHYFISWRYLLVIIVAVGIIPILARRAPVARRRVAILLLTTLLVPFLLSFVRGDRPWLRVFVNLTPVLALLVGLSAGFLETAVPAFRRRAWLALLILLVYCQGTFAVTRLHVRYRLAQDIGLGSKSQDIFYSYYQEHYHPRALARELAARIREQSGPTVLLDFDQAALPVYLEHAGIKWHARDALAPLIANRDRVYVVTAFPNRFRAEMRRGFPHITVEQLNSGPRFHATFRLTP